VLVQKPQLGAGSLAAELWVRDKGEFGREKPLSSFLLTLQLAQHVACRGYSSQQDENIKMSSRSGEINI